MRIRLNKLGAVPPVDILAALQPHKRSAALLSAIFILTVPKRVIA
jgi:hypothetical protein